MDAHGEWLDQSETVTLFIDLCVLAPATLVDAPVRWEELGPDSVRGSVAECVPSTPVSRP